MRLKASISGDLKGYLRAEARGLERAVPDTIDQAAEGLQADLRADALGAGLGQKVANAWRRRLYGKNSGNVAGLVWTKAPNIVRGFEEGATIRAKDGRFLAIPGPAAPVHVGRGKKPTPALVEERFGIKLQFVYRRGGPSLLVARLRASQSSGARRGRLKGFRAPSATALRTGRGLTDAIMFYLVPLARLQKRLDVAGRARKWESRLGPLLIENWDRLTKGDLHRLSADDVSNRGRG